MQGLLIVISGFSGVGKGTLVKELVKRYPDKYSLSVSATTRKPRTGEVDGREYFFISKKEFEKRIEEGGFIEHACYNGNYYGTPKDYVDREMNAGRNVILEIEMQGGLQIKARFPETLLLFVVPPSAEELKRRLVGRNTETKEEIERRLRRAVEETDYMAKYDVVTVNDDFEVCLEEIRAAIDARQETVFGLRNTADRLREELIRLTEEEI